MSKIYQLLVNNLKIFKPSNNLNVCKVEKILKSSLDPIPSLSPSVKTENLNFGWKSLLRQNITLKTNSL